MARTQITGDQVKDATIQKKDLDITTSGQSVITKVVAGTNISLTSTGVDAGTGEVTINATGGALSALSDVTITSPTNDQILKYNGTKWINAAAPSTFSGSYNDLTNKPTLASFTTLTSPASGQFLKYNGTAWVNSAVAAADVSGLSTVATSGSYADLSNKPTIPSALSSLSDVTITSPSSEQVLKYNGTAWVNAAAPASSSTFANGTAAAPSIAFTNSTGTGLFLKSASPNVLGISTGGALRAIFDYYGYFTIANPSDIALSTGNTYLTVYGNVGNYGTINALSTATSATGEGAKITMGGKYNSTGSYAIFGQHGAVKENSTNNNFAGAYIIGTNPGTGTATDAPTERLRITSSGNVGIGEASPGARIQVNTGAAGTKGLIVKAAASQTANLLEIQNSSGTTIFDVESTGTLDLNSNIIKNVGTPVSANDAATKAYVDAITFPMDVKNSCRVATTANITLSGTQTIDGVAVVAGDRVLVKNQSTASQNGIYVVSAGAWSRSEDANTNAEVTANMFVFVSEGSTQADTQWVLTTNDPITLDTTSLSFAQFGQSPGTGIATLNSLSTPSQSFATGTSGTNFNISSSGSTHTFNLPDASATARGLVTTGTQTFAGDKTFLSNVTSNGNFTLSNTLTSKRYVETAANEFSTSLAPSTGTLTVDSSVGNVVLGALNASVTTWAFTNVPTDNSRVTSVSVIIAGNTSYTYGSACSVNGTAVGTGVQWFGGTAPTASNTTDVLTFVIVRDSAGALRVLGSAQTIDSVIGSASAGIDGAGSTNYLSKWTDSNTIANSLVFDNGTTVGIGTTSPSAISKLHITRPDNGVLAMFERTSGTTAHILVGLENAYFTTDTNGNYSFACSGTQNNCRIITNGVERLRIDSAGNVGIGTTSPTDKLHIVDTLNAGFRYQQYNEADGAACRLYRARGTVAAPSATQSGDRLAAFVAGGYGATGFTGLGGGMSIHAAENHTDSAAGTFLILQTTPLGSTASGGGAERMRIDSNGNVGIGTTNPAGNLEVAGTTGAAYISRFSANTVDAALIFRKSRGASVGTNTIVSSGDALGGIYFTGANGSSYNTSSAIIGFVDGTPGASNDMPGRLTFLTTADGSGTLTERMRITNAGNVGINTINPGYPLTVQSESTVAVGIENRGRSSDDIGTILLTQNNGTEAGRIESSPTYLSISKTGNNLIRFYTNATERLRISGNGQVSIGTTATGATLSVQNNLNNNNSAISAGSNVAGDAATAGIAIIKKDNISTTSQSLIQFLINGGATGSGQINANGALQAAFGSYSDARLKENITDLPSQLDKILALRPVEFDYKDGSGHQTGFIAQEVQTEYPDLVAEGKDGYLTLSGLGKNEARLIKAIQELSAKVDALQAENLALETRLTALENG